MSKKEKIPSTPETRAKALADKQEVMKVFKKTFFPALAICLSLLLIFSVSYIAFYKPADITVEGSNPVSGNVSTNTGSQSTDTPAANTDTPAANTDTPAADANNGATNTPATNNGTDTPAANAGAPAGTLSASSSTAEIVNYFNTAINKVKPSAKQVELTKELNKEAGGIEGNLPGTLTSIANSLISSNMGEKDLSSLDPGMVKATTAEQKNAMFPVENESWSSKLTADDVEKAEVQENGGKYVITLHIKADEPSESTAHGVGHCGKIFSVIMPSIVTDNAGPAASIIKEVKTGHKDGVVKITVDKATGNVTDAFYSYVWTLSLKALGAELSIPFGLEKTFVITW